MTVYAERMSTTRGSSPREQIAANVSAELKRSRIAVKSLADLLGGSQSSWQRRASGEVPFTAEDLLLVAGLLDVPIDAFLVGVKVSPGSRNTHEYTDLRTDDQVNALNQLLDDIVYHPAAIQAA